MVNELFRKTDQPDGAKKTNKDYIRLSVSLDKQTAEMLKMLVRQIEDETGFKIAKSDLVRELIKLLPVLKLQPFYLGSLQDLESQFETIKKKLNQL